MSDNEHKRKILDEALRTAEHVLIDQCAEDPATTARLLAEAVEILHAAVKHYEGALTWDISCLHCSALLDRCCMLDRHLDEARGAHLAALTDALKWRRLVAANGSEAEVWARSRPEPLPAGTTLRDAIAWPKDEP
jgi:hypothetical protein